jgi:RNA polymerase sigma factor (sigma-70 family)
MTQLISDAELCRACCVGERDAFRQVVQRYQGLVTSITYNATGDIPISEDLAQDTFLQAWRKMGSLREPEKLGGWLCTIARNRVRDWLRRKRTDVDRQAVALVDVEPVSLDGSEPGARMEREDEATLVWRAIESIPEDYREVLVLHYREQAGAAEMAVALSINEAAVRQRLSRARAMVRREVVEVVERGLRHTRPSPAFTVAVMAALPALTPKIASAAVGGSAAAKSAGSLFALGVWIGPVIGLLGGLFGTLMSIKNTDSAGERKFMVRYAVVVWVMVGLFMVALVLVSILAKKHLDTPMFFVVQSGMMLLYVGLLVPVVIWGNRRQRAIRLEQGSPHWSTKAMRPWSTPVGVYGGLGGAVLGSMAWMVLLAVQVGDWFSAGWVAAAAIAIFGLASRAMKQLGPGSAGPILYGVAVAISVVTTVIMNTRLHAWIAHLNGRTIAQVRADLPLWTVNLLMATAFIVIVVTIRLGQPSGRRGSSTR